MSLPNIEKILEEVFLDYWNPREIRKLSQEEIRDFIVKVRETFYCPNSAQPHIWRRTGIITQGIDDLGSFFTDHERCDLCDETRDNPQRNYSHLFSTQNHQGDDD